MEQQNQNSQVEKREMTIEVLKEIQEHSHQHLHADMKRMWQENHDLSVQEAIKEVEEFAQAMGI